MDQLDYLRTENLAYKRKLQSKSEALNIINNQLISCQAELDQLRLKFRTQCQDEYENHNQHHSLGQQNVKLNKRLLYDVSNTMMNGSAMVTPLEILNKKLTDENKLLLFEMEDLKQRLSDAVNDMKVLRKEKSLRKQSGEKTRLSSTTCEDHLEQLELLNKKQAQLENDIQVMLDEKQDLIKQRDIYYNKMHRLNTEIKNLLKISNQNVDFDNIVMENKYLKQRLEEIVNEKKLWSKTISKYKTMLSNGANNTGKILSYDQIAKHINSITTSHKEDNIKQICITLLETLNEKNLLLQHQRKTNKILANRILELETNGGISSSDILLQGYSLPQTQRCDLEEEIVENSPKREQLECENRVCTNVGKENVTDDQNHKDHNNELFRNELSKGNIEEIENPEINLVKNSSQTIEQNEHQRQRRVNENKKYEINKNFTVEKGKIEENKDFGNVDVSDDVNKRETNHCTNKEKTEQSKDKRDQQLESMFETNEILDKRIIGELDEQIKHEICLEKVRNHEKESTNTCAEFKTGSNILNEDKRTNKKDIVQTKIDNNKIERIRANEKRESDSDPFVLQWNGQTMLKIKEIASDKKINKERITTEVNVMHNTTSHAQNTSDNIQVHESDSKLFLKEQNNARNTQNISENFHHVPNDEDDVLNHKNKHFGMIDYDDAHEDIQSLPIELQKLVLQAMKEIEMES